jgi:Arylsulfotransferase (ASST)
MRGLLLAMCLALMSQAAKAAPALHVNPFPGTPDASPTSEVIFSSLRPSDIRSVTIRGTRTGAHSGHLASLPAQSGTAFVPDVPFAGGERVEAITTLDSPQAGTAAGAPGATRLNFSFTVRRPLGEGGAVPGSAPGATTAAAGKRPAYHRGRLRFHSQPGLYPPRVTMSTDPDRGSGDIFLTPHNGGQNGPMILNSQGQLVWFHPFDGKGAFNLEVQHYQGRPVLTWWQGNVMHGQGDGADVILDRSYRRVALLHAGNGYTSDLHEFQITRQGTALIDAYVLVRHSLTSVGGPANGKVWDCVIQELDIRTGRVLWEWHSLGHVPINESHAVLHRGRAYDYFHLNSIQQLRDGNLLVSARNMWAAYKINRVTGQVMWKLGGKRSGFHMGRGTNFEWQHDVHISGQTVTVFDDAASPPREGESSAKTLRVNIARRKVTLEHRYVHYPPLLAGAMGSAQLLGNRNIVVGWGTADDFSEYRPSGHLVFNGSFPIGTNSYRAYRFSWSGQPGGRPALAVSAAPNGNMNAFASWNGATQVASWRVLGGASKLLLRRVGSARRTDFETVITLRRRPRYVAVQALSASGDVLGTSRAAAAPSHASFTRHHAAAGQAARARPF